MPACTAFGVKSSSSVASWLGRSPPELPPQPAAAAATSAARRIEGSGRTGGMVPMDAPSRHLLAQPDAVTVADVQRLLQVLRLRDAPAAPARARGGRTAARRRR